MTLWTKWRRRKWLRIRFVLDYLRTNGESSTYELWEAGEGLQWPVKMSLGAVYVTVDELERLGYVTTRIGIRKVKVPGDDYWDRTAMMCALTDLGRQTRVINL